MAYCPNCQLEIAAEAKRCTRCNAVFGADGWGPTDQPGTVPAAQDAKGGRILSGIVKVLLAVTSLFFLALGFAFGNGPWRWAAVALMLAVFAMVRIRAAWMILAVIGSFAFFFASCTENFHWNG